MALMATLNIVHRQPIALIQQYLYTQHALALSQGEIVDVLQTVAKLGQSERDALLASLRTQPVVHADETGWRENGQHGYLWLACTDDTCVIERHASRGSQGPRALLGADFSGTLVTDFYAAYNILLCRHQRCWVHLLRDVDALRLAHPDDPAVQRWCRKVRALYRYARAVVRQPGYADLPEPTRIAWRQRCEQAALTLATPVADQDCPHRVLAKRLRTFHTELFVCVEDPRVPFDNNDAERNFRPHVVARVICGGTRSAKGSVTKTTLQSLLTTARLREMNPMDALLRLLLGQPMFQTA